MESLDQFIDKQIASGVADPHEIAERAFRKKTWLLKELEARLREIVAEIARQRMGVARRAVLPGATRYERAGIGFLDTTVCVANTWMFHKDMTADHCDARAAEYRDEARKAVYWAKQYETWAKEMRSRGVETLGELFADDGSEEEAA